jgi:flagellar hook assembly protein FlgD
MSSEVEVRIYNIAGELVHRGSASGMARSYRWDLRNRSGTMVTSGLYVVVLEANDPARGAKDRAIMKLAVSRP